MCAFIVNSGQIRLEHKIIVAGIGPGAKETIPATGHTEAEDAAVAATCTTAGKTAGTR